MKLPAFLFDKMKRKESLISGHFVHFFLHLLRYFLTYRSLCTAGVGASAALPVVLEMSKNNEERSVIFACYSKGVRIHQKKSIKPELQRRAC
jgi:hypothetical protein